MHTPPPHPDSNPPARTTADDLQVLNWLRLRQELAELHARLEYLKLMLKLGLSR